MKQYCYYVNLAEKYSTTDILKRDIKKGLIEQIKSAAEQFKDKVDNNVYSIGIRKLLKSLSEKSVA